jgi:hypothetical protein
VSKPDKTYMLKIKKPKCCWRLPINAVHWRAISNIVGTCMKQVSPGVQTVVGASSPGDAAVTVSDLHIQHRVLSLSQL